MEDNGILGLIVAACGLFSLLGGAMNWGFFMGSRKAQRMVRLMGHNGARGLYVVLGLFLMGLGGAMTAGMLQ